MKQSPVATCIALILVILLMVVMPTYYIGIIQWARSEEEVMARVTALVDEVADTRVLTEDTLADFNLAVAAISDYYAVNINRQVKVINPDPNNPGKTISTYQAVDNIHEWRQGDKIFVTIHHIGSNTAMSIASRLLGMTQLRADTQFVRKVR